MSMRDSGEQTDQEPRKQTDDRPAPVALPFGTYLPMDVFFHQLELCSRTWGGVLRDAR